MQEGAPTQTPNAQNVRRHYDEHLAERYQWLSGGAEGNYEANRRFFKAHRLLPSLSVPVAIDLGAGSGFQSVPLAEAGYQVFAVDVSERLLAELDAVSKERGLNVKTLRADLADPSSFTGKDPELIVCMGDTLTHLDSLRTVESLVYQCFDELMPGGHLALSFRDFSEARRGAARFLLTRSEADLIATVGLQFGETHVTVSDLFHERGPDGEWTMRVSSYEKLRIAPPQLAEILEDAGFDIAFEGNRMGLHEIVGAKP